MSATWRIESFLLVLCLTLQSFSSSDNIGASVDNSENSVAGSLSPASVGGAPKNEAAGRSLRRDEDVLEINENDVAQSSLNLRRTKPIRNIFMGIYKNYKSTYLGNRTSLQYRKSLSKPAKLVNAEPEPEPTTEVEVETTTKEAPKPKSSKKKKKKSKKKKKKNKDQREDDDDDEDDSLLYSYNGEYRYNIGPGVNVSLDTKSNIVSVNLDEGCLKDIILGLDDDNDEGRGKKQDMITKILPLFILPFLIQSAIVPFLVTKLKLLLVKSILVGKLAIFLIIISMIKNSQKSLTTYETAPSYWASEPSRRSEALYSGYRVEGRPTTWVN